MDVVKADPAKQPKNTWETVFTLTPVILTLLATVLAGLSSSEMIQAQYYRSMAAQNQSKAGDQWGFFQAKRIRSTIAGRLLDQKPGIAGPIEIDEFRAGAQRLADRFEALEERARRLKAVVPAGGALDRASEKLLHAANGSVAEAKREVSDLVSVLGRAETKTAFAFLGSTRLPEAETESWHNADIEAALKATSERRPETEVASLLLTIGAGTLRDAVDIAETNARKFENAAKAVDRTLEGVDAVTKKLRGSAHALHRAAGGVEAAASDLPSDTQSEPVRQAVANLVRADQAVQRSLDDLSDYLDAREDYTARRNEREARYNQSTAGLYELQVQESSLTSERHRKRSKNFFYGMLCAQAGVAIASISLAARHKSALWGTAGAAGLTALVFSIYIYLYV
jgi:Domain of unknown function (DUF4337)